MGGQDDGRQKEKRQPYAAFVMKSRAAYFFMPYFWRNFSTRPAVSTIFCLPV